MNAALAMPLGACARRNPSVDVDAAMVARAGEGDRAAFGLLVRRHQKAVFFVAMSVLGDADLAMDAAQEAFVRAHGRLGTFRGDASFKTWLCRVALHAAVDLRRQRRRRPERAADDEVLARVADPGRTADDALELAEERTRLAEALSSLAPVQRTIVALRDLEGLSYRTIARILDIPVGTVMSRLFYARRALKDRVAAGLRPVAA